MADRNATFSRVISKKVIVNSGSSWHYLKASSILLFLQEAFYDERSNTGFLAAKIKNVNRGERLSSPSKSSPPVPRTLDGGPRLARKVDSDGRSKDEDDADINWMKHTPASPANIPMVMEKMRATLSVRRKLVNDEAMAAVVIREFPQFQVTPGLVS